jgi:hypothetical protein
MKNLIIFCFFITSIVSAQVDVFTRYTPESKELLPTITYYGEKDISQKVKMTAFALVNKGFSELLVGASYSPQEWVTLGLSLGVESNNSGCRLGSSLWLEKNNHSLFVIGELGNGEGNYFYRATYKYKINTYYLGATAWRFHGVGPTAGVQIKKLDTTVWIAPLYDMEFEVPRLVIGTKIKF